MLVYGEKFNDVPIMSLQTSQEIARTESAIIDPTHLTIPAFYVTGPTLDFSPAILRTADIREIGKLGLIVNSSDEFTSPDDLVTMKKIIDLTFTLEGKQVIDSHKRKLGKVARYTLNPETFVIHQLYVKRPFPQNLSETELLIHRQQIIAINHTTITVEAPDMKVGQLATKKQLIPNPFQQAQPKAEA